ncbi:unnamed protein product [Cochlearia groenlandica]
MMMNKVVMCSIMFLMLVGSVLVVEARPLNRLTKTEKKIVVKFFDGLSLGAIKQGPSSGGEGHRFVDRSEPVVYSKHSGPSPSGPGH